ncbi:uncharacterized protein LOC117174677 [Belonocnema kinseyi]|uniref:uncharacterized protein LOC117174677 n=1 Tax=Belonocnema kinseyi TaxID=2817044 RepID=UPI00143D8DFC|nr:uncharacterized protein LOC117174677 [Belonocnema kinseyi]
MKIHFENSLFSEEKKISGLADMSPSIIKQDILGSPPARKFTEAEMRVQRALKKLNIPEWYLNKKSKAPKILKNNTPIDCRQPSWKRGTKPNIMSKTCPLEDTSDPTGIYRTNERVKASTNESLLSGSYDTPRMFENSINKTSLSTTYEISEEDISAMEHSEKMQLQNSTETAPNQDESAQTLRAYSLLKKSDTFPKMSPSRKVQNINIVFPPTSNSPAPNISQSNPPLLPLPTTFDTDVYLNCTSDISKLSQTVDSSFDDFLSADDKFITPKYRNKVTPTSCFKTNLANAISPKPFTKKVSTPYGTPASNFNILSNSSLDGTRSTLFASAMNNSDPSPVSPALYGKPEDFSFSSINSYNSLAKRSSLKRTKDTGKKQSTCWLGEVKAFGADRHETCQECGSKPPRIFAAVTTLSPNNSKNFSNEEYLSRKFSQMMGISDAPTESSASSSDEEQRESPSVLPPERFINIKNTSNELSDIYKMNQLQHSKNLVQEIIEELKAKCALKAKASYSSPVTKHFVHRLVNDLQGENSTEHPEVFEEQEVEAESCNMDSGSRSSSDLEINSAALSTSISIFCKDSDSGSDCAPVTSTLKKNDDNPHFNKKSIHVEPSPYDDGVFWIPLQLVDVPRTSSQISTMSKHSENQSQSPSISPISDRSDFNQADEGIYQNYCETSCSKLKDSGYSDRSSVKSRTTGSSLSDWSEESDSLPTESEKSFSSKATSNRVYLGSKSGVYVL